MMLPSSKVLPVRSRTNVLVLAMVAGLSLPGMGAASSLGASVAASVASASKAKPTSVASVSSEIAGPYTGAPANQILARVGDQNILAIDLEQALSSSPVSTSFVSMNEDDQARVRGDMLQRLITSELIYLEALAAGVTKSPEYLREMSAYRTSLLGQRLLDSIRAGIKVPPAMDKELSQRLRGDADALAAARSAFVARQFPALRDRELAQIRSDYHLKTYPERVTTDAAGDTVVAEGDGFRLLLAQLKGGLDSQQADDQLKTMKRRLEDGAEVAVMARAALDRGIDVSHTMERYGHDLAARLLMRSKQQEWVPGEDAVRAWFKAHPDVALIPTRYHVGQIVTKTRDEAEAALAKIRAGESLFTLAGDLSIDPYGREHNGDMGWFRAGQGFKVLDETLEKLADGEVSEVVESPAGFHIVTVLERRPGKYKPYTAIKDRVAQAMIAEKLPDFLVGLEKKFGVELVDPSASTQTSGN